MKISGLKKAFGFQSPTDIATYITTELTKSLVELQIALTRRLRFEDNFNSFQVDVSLDSGDEISIQNQLSVIPTRRIIVRSNNEGLVDGEAPWTRDLVSLKNVGSQPVQATVIFLE